jgi:hypothetical protein
MIALSRWSFKEAGADEDRLVSASVQEAHEVIARRMQASEQSHVYRVEYLSVGTV